MSVPTEKRAGIEYRAFTPRCPNCGTGMFQFVCVVRDSGTKYQSQQYKFECTFCDQVAWLAIETANHIKRCFCQWCGHADPSPNGDNYET